MNLSRARIILRPRGVTELFDLGLLWCTRVGGRTYLALCAVLLVPAYLLLLALHYGAEVSWPAIWIGAYGVLTLAQGPFTLAASDLMFSEQVSVRSVGSRYVRAIPTYVAALVVTRVMVAVGFVTGFFMFASWRRSAYIHETVLLERQPLRRSLTRAAALGRQSSSATPSMVFGHFCAATVFVVVAEALLRALISFVLQLGSPIPSLYEVGGSPWALPPSRK